MTTHLNWLSIGVEARVGKNRETTTTTKGKSTGVDERVAGQSMEKSGNNSLQKKASRSATGTRTMMGSNGHSTGSVDDESVGMDLEAAVAGQSMERSAAGQLVEKSGNKSLQKEISRAALGTSRLTNTSTSTSTTTHSNEHSTGSIEDARVGMVLEEVTGQSMEKSSTPLQKEISRSAASV
jgi:hypothetical protein